MMESYTRGNAAFAEGDFDNAAKSYSECIGEVKISTDNPGDLIYLRALCNRSYCYLKLRNYSDAANDLALSLQILDGYLHNGNENPIVSSLLEKCLLRRAMCYEYMTEYTKAAADLETLQNKFPNVGNGKVVKELANRLRDALRRDKVAVHAEPRPDYLISNAQRLRLSFLVDLPPKISINTRIFCKLCIGNEFGLFNRSYFRPEPCSRERILLDLSDPLPIESNKLEEANALLPISSHIGRLGCRLIGLDGLADLVIVGADGNSNPTWLIGPDGKCVVSFTLQSSEGTSRVDSTISVLMQFFVVEHELSCGLSSSIMEVLSLPLFVHSLSHEVEGNEGNGAILRKVCEDIQASCIRRLDIPGSSLNSVYALESPGLLGIGGKIWDSSFVLIQYLAYHRHELITAKNVLELGSGTGVTGLSLARFLPSRMIVTDLAPVVPLMKANIFLNRCIETNPDVAAAFDCNYCAMEHSWGESFSSILAETDWQTIIAADVIYNPEYYWPLYQSIRLLLLEESRHERQLILAHRHRHPEDKNFFQMISDDNRLEMTQINWMEECGMMDNVDIKVYRIKAKVL